MTGPGLHGVHRVRTGQPLDGHPFALRDNRQDRLVTVCLNALGALTRQRETPLPASTGVLSVSGGGCQQHIQRVVDGVAAGLRPRQAFFARAGMHMMSTYASLALQSHGPCFSISGDGYSLRWALQRAHALVQSGACGAMVVLVADYGPSEVVAHAVLLEHQGAGRWLAAMRADDVVAPLPVEEMERLLPLLPRQQGAP